MTPAPLPVVKLTRWHRRLVVWTSLLLSLSGIVWMTMHCGIEYAPDYDGPEARKGIHLVLQAHGIVAYGAAIMLGTLLGRHIPSALRGWPWRWSGVVLLTLATALIATALMLYYVADEELREVASFVHQVSGLVAAGLAVSHFGRASRVKKAAGADVQPGAV